MDSQVQNGFLFEDASGRKAVPPVSASPELWHCPDPFLSNREMPVLSAGTVPTCRCREAKGGAHGVPEGTPAGFACRVPAALPPEHAPRGSVYKPGRNSRSPFPSRKKAFLLEYHEKRGPSRPLFAHIFRYRLRRPSRALARVTSSVYSRFPPMGIPCAIRVALTPKGFSSRAM